MKSGLLFIINNEIIHSFWDSGVASIGFSSKKAVGHIWRFFGECLKENCENSSYGNKYTYKVLVRPKLTNGVSIAIIRG
jgi:hypothetical protein